MYNVYTILLRRFIKSNYKHNTKLYIIHIQYPLHYVTREIMYSLEHRTQDAIKICSQLMLHHATIHYTPFNIT